jgi:hypothetical protein
MNIDNLKAQFKDYARANLYRVRFLNANGADADLLDFATKETRFPSIGMKDQPFEWRGWSMPVFTAADLGEWTCTFVCDDEMLTYSFFTDWMEQLVNPITGIVYPEKNASNVEANVYQVKQDMTFESMRKVRLLNCYPQIIGEIALGEEDGIAEFQVTFKYLRIGFK